MTPRIIQWGTGNVGKHALRAIVERPDLKLVGLRVYNPDKVGKDAGELLDQAPIGVVATNDIEQILPIEAHCVCYTALGSTLSDAEAPLDDICRLLASGKNVVFDGVVHGRPAISLELVWRVTDLVGRDWRSGGSRWIVHVDGDPTVDSEIAMSTSTDAGRATSLSVATLLVNSMPTVIAADPGLLDNLTIPMHGGGHFPE